MKLWGHNDAGRCKSWVRRLWFRLAKIDVWYDIWVPFFYEHFFHLKKYDLHEKLLRSSITIAFCFESRYFTLNKKPIKIFEKVTRRISFWEYCNQAAAWKWVCKKTMFTGFYFVKKLPLQKFSFTYSATNIIFPKNYLYLITLSIFWLHKNWNFFSHLIHPHKQDFLTPAWCSPLTDFLFLSTQSRNQPSYETIIIRFAIWNHW